MRIADLVLLLAIGCGCLLAIPARGDAPKATPVRQPIGYPSRAADLDVLPGFRTPPRGYGVVPFYWWIGDPLTKERLLWQLERLAETGATGLQVNYAHSDKGGNSYGLTYPSDPPLFSKQWWDLFTWWAGECNKRGVAVSLSDYTLGIVGQGYWMDEILAKDPTMRGSVLEHAVQHVAGAGATIELPEGTLCATAYRVEDGAIVPGSATPLPLVPGARTVEARLGPGEWEAVIVRRRVVPTSVDPINPKLGPMVIDTFFRRFEDHLPGQAGKGLDFFFSDELTFGVGGRLWNDRVPAEFRRRKGYDLLPVLPALFVDIGPITPKVRMDYYDLIVALSEESYFRPVFEWHDSRGMVYGCDHGGRGTDVTEFGDYFRTQRWMTGPGCDQPGLSSNIVKNKVASSIAHLYERPRTWLEGYHSSGWGTNTADLTHATVGNFAAGQNLLSLHGLYYTTHGGWWEWAPPCNHFRMPYWAHMKLWMQWLQRMSYVLSQGVHRCDVAVLYPVAPVEAGMDGGQAVQAAFQVCDALYDRGIDLDFIDFESLARCKVAGKQLHVAGEAYRALILPHPSAVRSSTLDQALRFWKAGGTVVALGALPEASEVAGRDAPALDGKVRELFGLTAKDARAGRAAPAHRGAKGGVAVLLRDEPDAPREYPGGFRGRWVWSAEHTPRVWFKAVWRGGAGTHRAKVMCDNEFTLYQNGREVARGDYQTGWAGDLDLKPGDVLTIDGHDFDAGNHTAGLFVAVLEGGKTVLSAEDFRCAVAEPKDANWRTDAAVDGLAKPTTENVHEAHKGGGSGVIARAVELIRTSIPRDFACAAPCHVLHRKAGPRDIYLVAGAPAGAECTFAAKGRVELWDPWTGGTREIEAVRQTATGTVVRLPDDRESYHMVVFSPGQTRIAKAAAAPRVETLKVEGPWEFGLKPTMDNRWGDFRLPASQGMIGAEARRFAIAEEAAPNPGWQAPDLDTSAWQRATYGFGQRFWKLGPIHDGADAAAIEAKLAALTQVDPSVPIEAGGHTYRWQPYSYSLREGVEGDPGHEGYHGLKELVSDDFIALGKRTDQWTNTTYVREAKDAHRYYLWATVRSDRDTDARMLIGGLAPSAIWLAGKQVQPGDTPKLAKGATPVLLRYDDAGRGHFVLAGGAPGADAKPYPLAMSWYRRADVLPFDPMPERSGAATWFRFVAPPGLRAMTVTAYGSVEAWIGGERATVSQVGEAAGARVWRVSAATNQAEASAVAFRIVPTGGCHGGAIIPEPVALDCGVGSVELGDWSKVGALECYSGGAVYRKTVTLTQEQIAGRVTLDLGSLVSSAEVRVNGKGAGVRLAPPWRFDIGKLARPGENRIEVTVYNTLANHYLTIPTRYRGDLTSGLLGPVTIEIESNIARGAATD